MTRESASRIKTIINAIDCKLEAKTINLASGVQILCNGYATAKGTDDVSVSEGRTGAVQIASVERIKATLNKANQATGYKDSTLTEAVRRLCSGYVEQAPLYSFGVLSDLHIQYETGLADFQRALTHLKDRVPFTCVCGDLVSFASAENMAQYKSYVDTYAGDMPLYECAGNHETYPELGVGGDLDADLWTSTTGKDAYYSATYGDDVFLFLSLKSERPNDLFVDGGLDWLRQTLEANKDKRCFVFQHVQDPEDDTADPSHAYSSILGGTSGAEFLEIIRQYKNTVWFHGHTHLTFGATQYPVGENLGYRSVHIPSLQGPRFHDKELDILESYYYDEYGNKIWGAVLAEGYIVDVYENKIVLRGINFAAGTNKDEVAPFADEVYVLDTTLQTIE